MTLIYYDTKSMPAKDLQSITTIIRDALGDNVLFLPKEFDVFLDASKEQLLEAKKTIEDALTLKEAE